MSDSPPDYLHCKSALGDNGLRNPLLRYVGDHKILGLLLKCQDIQFLDGEKPSNALVGQLYAMCSNQEIVQKVNVNTANDLERSRDRQVNKYLALKSFQRSDASRIFSPEEIRPLIWCRRTLYNIFCYFIDADISPKPYLMRNDYTFIDVYNFLRDRLRSIWQDLTVQHCTKHRAYIECFEISIRFLLYSHYQLLDHSEYDSVQNLGLINTCLEKLMNGYVDVKNYRSKPVNHSDEVSDILVYSSPHQDEFWSYRLLLAIRNIQNNGGGTIFADICKRIPHEIFKSSKVQFAARAYIAVYNNDICNFFNLFQQATPLQAILMNRFSGIIRIRWLYYLTKDKILRSNMCYNTFIKYFGYESQTLADGISASGRCDGQIKPFVERYNIEISAEDNIKSVNLSGIKIDTLEEDVCTLAKICDKIEVTNHIVELKLKEFESRQKILDPDFECLPPVPFEPLNPAFTDPLNSSFKSQQSGVFKNPPLFSIVQTGTVNQIKTEPLQAADLQAPSLFNPIFTPNANTSGKVIENVGDISQNKTLASPSMPINPDSTAPSNPIMQMKIETGDKFLIIKKENNEYPNSNAFNITSNANNQSVESKQPILSSNLESFPSIFAQPMKTEPFISNSTPVCDITCNPLTIDSSSSMQTFYSQSTAKTPVESFLKIASEPPLNPGSKLPVVDSTQPMPDIKIPPLNLQNSLKYTESISSSATSLASGTPAMPLTKKFDISEFNCSVTSKLSCSRISTNRILSEKKTPLHSLSISAVTDEIRELQDLLKKRELPESSVDTIESEERVVKKIKVSKKTVKRNLYIRVIPLFNPRRILTLWVDDLLNNYYYYKRLLLNVYCALKDYRETFKNLFTKKDAKIDPLLQNVRINAANISTAAIVNHFFDIQSLTFRIHFICNVKPSSEGFLSHRLSTNPTTSTNCLDLASLFLSEMGFSNNDVFLNKEISITKYGYYSTMNSKSKKKFTAIYSLSRTPVIVNTNVLTNGFVMFLDMPIDVTIRDGDITHPKNYLSEWLKNLHVLTIEPILENIKKSNGRHGMIIFYMLRLHCDKSTNLDAMEEKIDLFSKNLNKIIFKHISALGSIYLNDRMNSGRISGKKVKSSPFKVENLGYVRMEGRYCLDSVLYKTKVNDSMIALIKHCFDNCGVNFTLNQPTYESIKNSAVRLLMNQWEKKTQMDTCKTCVLYNMKREIVSGLSNAIYGEITNFYVNYPLQARKSIVQCIKNTISNSQKSKDNHHAHFLLDRILKNSFSDDENITEYANLRGDLERCIESASASFHIGPGNFQMISRNKDLATMQQISSCVKFVTTVLDHLQIDTA